MKRIQRGEYQSGDYTIHDTYSNRFDSKYNRWLVLRHAGTITVERVARRDTLREAKRLVEKLQEVQP